MYEVDYYTYDENLSLLLTARGSHDFVPAFLYFLDRGISPREICQKCLESYFSTICFDGQQFKYPYAYGAVLNSFVAMRHLLPAYDLLPVMQQLWYFIRECRSNRGPSFVSDGEFEGTSEMRLEGWLERGRRDPEGIGDWRLFYSACHKEFGQSASVSELKMRVLKSLLRAPGLGGFSFRCVLDACSATSEVFSSGDRWRLLSPALASAFFGYSDDETLKRASESIRVFLGDGILQKGNVCRRNPPRRTLYEGEILEFEKLLIEGTEDEVTDLVRRWLHAQKNVFEIFDAMRLCLAECIFELPHDTWFATLQAFHFLLGVDEYAEGCVSLKEQAEALYLSLIFLKRVVDRNRPLSGVRPENFRMSDNLRNMTERLMISIGERDLERGVGIVKYILKERGCDRELMDRLVLHVSKNEPSRYRSLDLKFVLSAIKSYSLSLSSHRGRYLFAVLRFFCDADRDEHVFNQIRNTQRVRIWV